MTTTHDRGTYRPPAPGRPDIRQRTLRTDRWWLPPLANALGLATFVVYATIRAFSGVSEPCAYAPVITITPFWDGGCGAERAIAGRENGMTNSGMTNSGMHPAGSAGPPAAG